MTTDTVGGVWSYSIDLARRLCANGFTILLAAMGRRATASQRAEAESIRGLEFVDSEYPLEWMPGVSDSALAEVSDWLIGLAAQFDAELVHLNDYVHGSAGWDVPVVVVAHSCVYSWWLAIHGCLPPPEWQDYKRRVTRGLSAASAVVAPSWWMADSLQQLYGCDPQKLTVIPNFSDLQIHTAIKRNEIFAAGRFWDVAKNLQLLEQIAPHVSWPVRLAGDVTSPDQDRAAPKHIQVEGFLSRADVAKRLAQCRIFAHPAKYEPFGLSVLEAARNGCALLLSDIPSLREIWAGSAVFVSPDDSARWIERLMYLIENHPAREEYGRKALERSRAFSAAKSTEQYAWLYRTLAGNHQRSALLSA
jgi:glycosyltransferase involved in cell wall biosynthesis